MNFEWSQKEIKKPSGEHSGWLKLLMYVEVYVLSGGPRALGVEVSARALGAEASA